MSEASSSSPAPLGIGARWAVLIVAFCGLVFDGIELGLMPVASLSVSESLLGDEFTHTLAGDWFARFTASLMLGAAVGGIILGSLGDRIGRTRAMGVSILFYSLFAGLGAFVQTQEQMLVLRFFVGLGVGGMWPNGVVLVSECWPNTSRPVVAGVMGAGINFGVLLLSQIARVWTITPDSWRWIFKLAAIPAVLGVIVIFLLPESPKWLATRRRRLQSVGPTDSGNRPRGPSIDAAEAIEKPSEKRATRRGETILRDLFRQPLLRLTLVGIVLASIPLVGAWAASKWMIPWADKLTSATQPGYKAVVQGWWALGATLGSFCGAQVAGWLGRRLSYFLISLGTTILTISMFQLTAPLEPAFLPVVFAQGFVATLFFGWLPLYLPELFPTRVRAAGTGVAMNTGRFATAIGVLITGTVFALLGGSYPSVGTVGTVVYALGMIAIWFAPDTSSSNLDD
jgi:MFS family permease